LNGGLFILPIVFSTLRSIIETYIYPKHTFVSLPTYHGSFHKYRGNVLETRQTLAPSLPVAAACRASLASAVAGAQGLEFRKTVIGVLDLGEGWECYSLSRAMIVSLGAMRWITA